MIHVTHGPVQLLPIHLLTVAIYFNYECLESNEIKHKIEKSKIIEKLMVINLVWFFIFQTMWLSLVCGLISKNSIKSKKQINSRKKVLLPLKITSFRAISRKNLLPCYLAKEVLP